MNDEIASTPTRGERNNNPCNLDYVPSIPWQGQLGVEILTPAETAAGIAPRFGRFDTAINGIRAPIRQLVVYQTKYGCRVLGDFIARWAPPEENDTVAYTADVAQWTGIAADAPVDMTDQAIAGVVIRGMIRQENGRCIYDDATIAAAIAAAFA